MSYYPAAGYPPAYGGYGYPTTSYPAAAPAKAKKPKYKSVYPYPWGPVKALPQEYGPFNGPVPKPKKVKAAKTAAPAPYYGSYAAPTTAYTASPAPYYPSYGYGY
jgi:hypothetical protein|uniref:Uncharacterized protein n=1 Tax=Eutreptiella gymnastica TaxID=73025 RepID=A0A7S4D3U5_9EUGL|eukprot:CAMPEP_0174285228 /NCGR_PEP_ID=MMETSP0809-20121228/8111_1 /TAXON_ID=73025 ORGANISM="Eutreptiella gymnastica-like, Strain CCMP1594" /NCGR_SAMPLE_ID=MMETSP0809 /ASSEMBLY_ACC=CAM_ASM_000658 /LENGTH=104 /DNA_ID=CAMNT_0015380941 /DNA_START=27 /DNA_END=341 /DNA_ORIENTATION=+